MDALKMLTEQHREVESMFRQYEGEGDLVRRRDLAERIMAALTRHAELEETQFYPVVREATPGAEQLTEESLSEHAEVKQTIARLEGMQPEDTAYHPTMQKLKGLTEHHVHEEETELFPKVSGALGTERLEQIGSAMEEMQRASAPRS